MTDAVTFARALTDREMERLKDKVHDHVADASQVIIEFFDIALAEFDSSFEEEEQINPTDFSIPEEQWGEIAGWLNRVFPLTDGTFNGALSWMNSGPSAYPTIDG